MTDFQEGHPCKGKDCRDCETCIFDRELFPDGVTPNESEKNKKTNNMCSTRLCNECINLSKIYDKCDFGHFDAACKVVSWEAFGNSHPRRIDFNVSPHHDIIAPNWCPLKSGASKTNLPAPVTHRPNPQQTGPGLIPPTASTPNTLYTKREKMKELRKHIEWDDIKEGSVYVIPRILSQARKIVKVITKTDMSCICHEISEYTGNEYNYNTTFYPTDLDAVFITEIHNF